VRGRDGESRELFPNGPRPLRVEEIRHGVGAQNLGDALVDQGVEQAALAVGRPYAEIRVVDALDDADGSDGGFDDVADKDLGGG
jgi:hypothetical protein